MEFRLVVYPLRIYAWQGSIKHPSYFNTQWAVGTIDCVINACTVRLAHHPQPVTERILDNQCLFTATMCHTSRIAVLQLLNLRLPHGVLDRHLSIAAETENRYCINANLMIAINT